MAKVSNTDIYEALANRMNLPIKAAKDYTDFIFDEICRHVGEGDEVTIRRFGRFYMAVTAPHKGRDIHRGIPVDVKAKNTMRFVVSSTLMQEWNPKDGENNSDL